MSVCGQCEREPHPLIRAVEILHPSGRKEPIHASSQVHKTALVDTVVEGKRSNN